MAMSEAQKRKISKANKARWAMKKAAAAVEAPVETFAPGTPIPEFLRKHDPVNHPSHYTSGAIECIDYMEGLMTAQEFVGYLRGNIIKYQHRMFAKDTPLENAAKMKWYLERFEAALQKLEA